MFDISLSELLLIALLVFLFFGPKRIPEIMRQVGQIIAKWRDIRWEVEKEVRKGMMEEGEKMEYEKGGGEEGKSDDE